MAENTNPTPNKKKPRKDFVTKEIFILLTPFLAAYLWLIFYETGSAAAFHIPVNLIQLEFIDVITRTNRFTIMVAMLAFLSIGFYYNILPNVQSKAFKGLIIVILIVFILLGYYVGASSSLSNSEHLITSNKSGQEFVVLKTYKNNMILAPYIRKQNAIEKAFHILKMGDYPDLKLTVENTGPLKIISSKRALDSFNDFEAPIEVESPVETASPVDLEGN